MKKICLLLALLFFVFACKEDEPAMANFEFTISDGGNVAFKNTSMNADSYEWDLGIGSKSSEMNPNIQYPTNGTYTVVLIAKGKKSQDTKIQKLTISNAPKPIVKFSWKSLGNGLIQFTNESTNADAYQWTFGNGEQSTELSPKVQYATNGTYEVKLEAKNINGSSVSTQNITIADAAKPIANFNFTYDTGGGVAFVNTSANANSYQWTFGNGQTSTIDHPYVTYSSNGTYTATLTAKNQNGENTVSKTININSIYVPTTGNVVFWSNSTYSIKIYINGAFKGTNTRYVSNGVAPGCGASGFVTVALPQGAYSFTAEEDRLLFASKWAGTVNIVNGKCSTMRLNK